MPARGYRGTEEVVYLEYGVQGFGLRPADDGPYRYHGVGIEHLAFEVDRSVEVDEAYRRCIAAGGEIQSPPEQHYARDGEDYNAFFGFDPAGIRIEVFAWPSYPTARTDILAWARLWRAQTETVARAAHTPRRIVGGTRRRIRVALPETGPRTSCVARSGSG